MRCLRIYATPDGESHFGEVDIAMTMTPARSSRLPHPVSSTPDQLVAESILRMPGRRAGPNGFRANGTSGTSDSSRL